MSETGMPLDDENKYPHQTTEGKRYRMLDEVRREYEASGVIFNTETNKIERGAITQENAKEMQIASVAARHENAIESARRGLVRGVTARELAQDHNVAWEHITAAQSELAMTPDMGHASTRAAEFVGKAADMMPTQARPAPGGGVSVRLGIDNVPLDQLVEVMKRLGNASDKYNYQKHSVSQVEDDQVVDVTVVESVAVSGEAGGDENESGV